MLGMHLMKHSEMLSALVAMTTMPQQQKMEGFRNLCDLRMANKQKMEVFRILCDLSVANEKHAKFPHLMRSQRAESGSSRTLCDLKVANPPKKKASAPYATSGWQAAPKLEVFRPYATSGWQPNIMRSQRAKSGSFPALCDLRVANKK